MKEKNTKKNWMSIKYKAIGITACVLLIVVATVFVTLNLTKEKEPEITNAFLETKLETASDLVPAKMIYNGLIRYEDGKVPFLTKKAFNMAYSAQVEMRVDVSKIKPEVTEEAIVLTVAGLEEPQISILSESIQFYDEKAALFNWEDKEDTVDAIKKAEEDVKQQKEMKSLEEMAKEQTEVLLKGLMEPVAEGRDVVVKWK